MKEILAGAAIFAALLLTIPMLSLGSGASSSEPKPAKLRTLNGQQVFRVLNAKTDQIEPIGSIDYICGVVAAEEPASFHMEALKAQAAAAYTYAVYQRERNLEKPGAVAAYKGADVSTDPNTCKAYLSKADAQKEWGDEFDADWGKIQKAVNAVAGKIVVYQNKPIVAVFCDMSSGTTESSKDVWGVALPYLVEVPSVGDTLAPGFLATQTYSSAQVKAKIAAKYPDADLSGDPAGWIAQIKRSKAGGVITAKVGGKSLRGETIRILLGLRSTNFQLRVADGTFTFTVKGYGHGVGLSQYGSEYLARQGKTWQQILAWYYPGTKLADYQWKSA